MSSRPTAAGAYQMIAAHEVLCAERYRGLNEKLTLVLGALASMVLALLGWALVQLYALQPMRLAPGQPPGRAPQTAGLAVCQASAGVRTVSDPADRARALTGRL
jgi:hypothetical protein